MRIPAECPKCREVDERRRSIREVSSSAKPVSEPVKDAKELAAAEVHSGKLTVTCANGHTVETAFSIPEFELLFDCALWDLLDANAVAAVVLFHVSFERFMEFACRFLMAWKNVSLEGIDEWWKLVARQSERQLGSFHSLWISEFKRRPPQLDQKLIKLRNELVHKGKISTSDKAKEYGQAVLRAELGGTVTLRNLFDSEPDYDFHVDHVLRRPDDAPLMSMEFCNVISGM